MEIKELLVELAKSECSIKDRPSLLEALQELDSLVGMRSAKQAVVEQLLFFLANIKAKGIARATDKHLLSALVLGASGTGKTLIGAILARIWSSLGILNAPAPDTQDTLTSKLIRDNITLSLANKVSSERLERADVAANATRMKIRELRQRIFALRTICHRKDSSEILPATLDENIQRLARISADALNYISMTHQTLSDETIISSPRPASHPPPQSVEVVRSSPEAMGEACLVAPTGVVPTVVPIVVPITMTINPLFVTTPKPQFKIVSRVNFVAEYVGQTAVKTRKLLEENRGNVLFVDEAYSLYHGDRDSFGTEALTVINQYMTENPDSTVLIFAGYKDLMQSTIFKAQPGLARRFAFTFEITGYTPEELSDIFLLQLKADDWQYSSRPELITFFTEHMADFPCFGGDTKRLIFQCKLLHTSSHWNDPESNRVLTLEILKEAFVKYKQHQPLDVQRLKALDAQRTYDDDVLQIKIKELAERKAHEELYASHRTAERTKMAQEISEMSERSANAELYDNVRLMQREELQRKVDDHTENKKFDRRERPEGMYN